MAFNFGVGTLSLLQNLLVTNCAVTTGVVSGAASHRVQVSSGLVMIDGVTCTVSATSITYTEAGATGSGLLLFAWLDPTSTITVTAKLAVMTAADPANTATNLPTAIAPLARFSYGTAAAAASTIVAWSGGSATRVIGKVQNVSINVSYENAQMRGGGDVFPVDTQFFNGSVQGSFEMADPTATQLQLLGGIYASAGAASGTWTLSAVSKPEQISMVFQNVTDGITSTYTVMRGYLIEAANEFNRTDYLRPSFNFVGMANQKGSVLNVQQ